MSTYRKGNPEASSLIRELIAQYHPELQEAGVRVGCRFAYAAVNESTGEPRGSALKHHGWPAAALVRIVSHKDRVAGLPDAIIDVDGEAFEKEWSEERKRAVLDHELLHLEVNRDEEGAIKLDDCNRPKLKMRLHDWRCEGFAVIAQRYSGDSLEVEIARKLQDEYGNLLFDFAGSGSA